MKRVLQNIDECHVNKSPLYNSFQDLLKTTLQFEFFKREI